jgi:glutamyl-tRNA reductase
MENLFYIGISRANQRPNPFADSLKFCSAVELAETKIGHDEYCDFLNVLSDLKVIEEVCVVSTCNRFEVIGFLSENELNFKGANFLIQEIMKIMQGFLKTELEFGTLVGNQARLQILRTFCGLNSGLIGEEEICSQFKSAFKQSALLKYSAAGCQALLNEAVAFRELFTKIIYKDTVSYCDVAIAKALMSLQIFMPVRDVVVLGSGSTALQSCLSLVKNGFRSENILLIHRISSSSIQIQRFQAYPELAGMRFMRSKKHGYKAAKVIERCHDTDLLVFGIDTKEPVMQIENYANLSIFDFNSYPSCTFASTKAACNYFPLAKLDEFVRQFACRRNNDVELISRLAQAEILLREVAFDYDSESVNELLESYKLKPVELVR